MNVPKKFLKSNEIDQSALQNLKAFYSKYSSAYRTFSKNPLKGNAYKESVITWLFSLTRKARDEICSVENKWATLVIHQLYLQTLNQPCLRFIFRDHSSSIPFMENITFKEKGLSAIFQPEPAHFLHYFAMVSENYEMSSSYDEVISLKFLKEILFYHNERSIIDYQSNNLTEYGSFEKKDCFCYFKLSKSVIFNKTSFLYYFNMLSNTKLFDHPPGLNPQGIDYPEWIRQPKDSKICFSLSEIIAAFLEQVISVKFLIEKYGKNGFDDIHSHLSECLKLKKSLKNFLIEKQEKDLYAYLHCEEIAKSVYYNAAIEKIIEAKTYKINLNNRYMLYWENNKSLEKVVNSVEKYMKSDIDEKTFVDRMFYRRLYQLYTQEDYYQRKVYALLSLYFDHSLNDNLYEELMKPSESSNKKKRNRKKKNKKVNAIQLGEDLSNVLTDSNCHSIKNDIINCTIVNGKETDRKNYQFIKPKDSNRSQLDDAIPNEFLSRFVKKDFMGVEMYINTYTATEVMIKRIIQDIITFLPINNEHEPTITLSQPILEDISPSVEDSSSKKKKKKEKLFLYSTEPKKKLTPKKDKKAFISILNNDIQKFEENTNQILSLLSKIKLASIAKLKSDINSIIVTPHEIELYGSYENGLSIEGSDIDMLVRTKKKMNLSTIMTHLTNHFLQSGLYVKVNSITTATVPVIKLKINPSTFLSNPLLLSDYSFFKESSYYREYLFEKEDLDYIKLDITFDNTSKSLTKSQVDYIKQAVSDFPQLKPTIKILKRLLNLCNMNNSYTGGLSSYSIFLLVYAFQKSYVKRPGSNCHSHLLMDLLSYYSSFDFYSYVIDVAYDNPFIKAYDPLETPPVILDPITKLNAARSSFKIAEVKAILLKCLSILNSLEAKYEDDKSETGTEENSIKQLMAALK